MSFIPWCALGNPPSVGDSGMETFVGRSWKKEIERKTPRKIVSLRVPGTTDHQKSSSVPDVIRICQEPCGQRKVWKKCTRVDFVIVPEPPDFDAPDTQEGFEFQVPASSCIPSIKRCSLDEIEAVKCRPERVGRKVSSGNATEKRRGRTQSSAELYKTPDRHPEASRTSVRLGSTSQDTRG